MNGAGDVTLATIDSATLALYRRQLLDHALQRILIMLLSAHRKVVSEDVCRAVLDLLQETLRHLPASCLAELVSKPELRRQAAQSDLTACLRAVCENFAFAPLLALSGKYRGSAHENYSPQAPVSFAFARLIERQVALLTKETSLVTVYGFLQNYLALVCAYLVAAPGQSRFDPQRHHDDPQLFVKGLEEVIITLLSNLPLVSAGRLSAAAPCSPSLALFLDQFATLLPTCDASGLRRTVDKLPLATAAKTQFLRQINFSLSVFAADTIMPRLAHRLRQNLTPFTLTAVQHLDDIFHKLILQSLPAADAVAASATFKKFVLQITLLAFSEVLTADGSVKIKAATRWRAPLLAWFIRKLLITILQRWLASAEFQHQVAAGLWRQLALERLFLALETAFDQGLTAQTLLSLPGFPLFGAWHLCANFMIPLTLTPVMAVAPINEEKSVAVAPSAPLPVNTDLAVVVASEESPDLSPTSSTIARLTSLLPRDTTANVDLLAYYREQAAEDNQGRDDINAIYAMLIEFDQLSGEPVKNPSVNLPDIAKQAAEKRLLALAALAKHADLNQPLQTSIGNLNSLMLTASATLRRAETVFLQVGKNYPGSIHSMQELRARHGVMQQMVRQVNFIVSSMKYATAGLAKQSLTHSLQYVTQSITALEDSHQKVAALITAIELKFADYREYSSLWITNNAQIDKFKHIERDLQHFFQQVQQQIEEKLSLIKHSWESYLSCKPLLLQSHAQGLAWTDLTEQMSVMTALQTQFAAGRRALEDECARILHTPRVALQDISPESFQASLQAQQKQLLALQAELFAQGNNVLRVTDPVKNKKDATAAVRAELYQRLHALLMRSADFWAQRIGFFGGGVACRDADDRPRVFPTRVAAMTNALKSLAAAANEASPDAASQADDVDTGLAAILTAYSQCKPGWRFGQAIETSKFYAIIQALLNLAQDDFYQLSELNKINDQLADFLLGGDQRLDFNSRFAGTIFAPRDRPPVYMTQCYALPGQAPLLELGLLVPRAKIHENYLYMPTFADGSAVTEQKASCSENGSLSRSGS